MAPEFLKCGRITFETDIYSLGVIIIEILMGCKERPNVYKVILIIFLYISR
jgi:serine/threonine protein kinase